MTKLSHTLATLTVVTTLILISIGGIVTSTDSGMAVPDWPTTFGYNMFLFPIEKTISGYLISIDGELENDLNNRELENVAKAISTEDNRIEFSNDTKIEIVEIGEWKIYDAQNDRTFRIRRSGDRLDVFVRGVLAEHGHRLIGSIVGLLTIALTIAIWIQDDRNWLKWLAVIALIGVIVQGVLGGLRVTEISRVFAIVHACLAQAFLGLCAAIALFTSRSWRNEITETQISGRLQRLSLFTTAIIYLQLIFGAILRHTHSQLHTHITFAVLISIHVLLITRRVFTEQKENRSFTTPTIFLVSLLFLQIVLGIGAWLSEFQLGDKLAYLARIAITTQHLIVAALMLIFSLILTLQAYKLKSEKFATANEHK